MEYKYAIVKIRDIDNLLYREEAQTLYRLLNKINDKREEEGKGINSYLVINTDEPYASEVVNILKANGHWGSGHVQLPKRTPINELINDVHQNAIDKGWYEEPRSFGDMIALMHSELSEALEEHRDGYNPQFIYQDEKGKPCGIPIELADVVIRIFDACGYYGIDLEEAIRMKMDYNSTRSKRHGGKKL